MPARLTSQKLADIASQKVEHFGPDDLDTVRKLPSHIQASGLGQTIAYYIKTSPPIADALVTGVAPSGARQTPLEYLKWLMSTASASEYRVATRSALVFASWLKRFAEARRA